MTAAVAGQTLCLAAAALVIVTGALASGLSPLAIPFIVWGLLPYVALFAIGRRASNPWPIAGAGLAALAVEAGIRASVFLYPRGSTAGIALLFSPALIAVAVMPAGAALGWGFGRVFTVTGTVVRALLAAIGAVVLGLAFIAFARPELFPTTLRARRQALAAIGEPRIVVGGDRFTRVGVHEGSAWHVSGDIDGLPGEEIAVVTHRGAQVIDALSAQPLGFIPFGGEPGRLWNWYSRLARIDGAVVVVQSGGGFSETQVMTLDNTLLWRFGPDPKLPPSALLPGDLDNDGEIEFYASTTEAVHRLDARGTRVWQRPATLADLVAVAAASPSGPAWVLAGRYEMSVHIWDCDGRPLAELKWPGARVIGVVEWPYTRSVVSGETSVKGVDVTDQVQFELALDRPLRLLQAVVWKESGGTPGRLAVVSGGDRDLQRWRLRVYESAESVVYDEVFDRPIRVLAPAVGDAAPLFVSAGSSLSTLRGKQ